MCDADPIERIPVLVLTPGLSTPLSLEEINSIGSHVKQVIATESGHWIHLDQPDLVIQSIFEMVMELDPCKQSVELCAIRYLSPAENFVHGPAFMSLRMGFR